MFKKTAFLFLTAFTIAFASSGSMERSRFLDTGFIDVGTKDNVTENLIAQQFVRIPAKTKLLDEIFDYKDRVYETYSCKLDNEGGETCPKDLVSCNASPDYDTGYSVRKTGIYTLEAPYTSGWINQRSSGEANVCLSSHIYKMVTWSPNDKTLQVFIFSGSPQSDFQGFGDSVYYYSYSLPGGSIEKKPRFDSLCNIGNFAQSFNIVDPVIQDGKVNIEYSFTSSNGCYLTNKNFTIDINSIPHTNHVLNLEELKKFALQSGYIFRKSDSYTDGGERMRIHVITHMLVGAKSTRIGQCNSLSKYSTFVAKTKGEFNKACPQSYNFNKDIDKCVKSVEYVYYEYKCHETPAENNPKTGKPYAPWVGPTNKGGDCGGVGLSANLECNSATPPEKNCQRQESFCPFDPKRPCFKNPKDEKAIAENHQKGYLYSAGTGQTFAKIITSAPICPNGEFNNKTLQCEATVEAKCPTGYIDTPYENTCVKKLNDPETEECDQGGRKTGNVCYTSKTQACPNGYMGDFKTKCYKEAECPKYHILTQEGKCELKYFYTEYTCPSGYENVKPQTSTNNDCKGLCGYDGCSCNSELPQADTCRKEVSLDKNTYEVSQSSPMLLHKVTPSKDYKVPFENFNVTNVPCNIETGGICKDNVFSITGNEEKLCFKKHNGQKYCYDVLGCTFSGSISSTDKIKDIYVTKDLQSLASKSGSGNIKSTCRLNGNVGYAERKEGITSVSPKLGERKFVIIKASGSASTTNGNWNGFSIANMAVQLTDGLWYTVESVLDAEGNRLVRNVPNFVVGLDRSMYKIVKADENCEVKGTKAENYCGSEIIMYMPNPDLGVIGVAELDALNKEIDASKNNVSLSVTVNDIKIPLTKSIDAIANNPFVVKPINAADEYDDRLNFWDNYIDGDIGFIEFVREVAPQDKKNGFVPENKVPFEMGEKGFTNIEYSKGSNTYEEYVPGKLDVKKINAEKEISGWLVPFGVRRYTEDCGGERSRTCHSEASGPFSPSIYSGPKSVKEYFEALCKMEIPFESSKKTGWHRIHRGNLPVWEIFFKSFTDKIVYDKRGRPLRKLAIGDTVPNKKYDMLYDYQSPMHFENYYDHDGTGHFYFPYLMYWSGSEVWFRQAKHLGVERNKITRFRCLKLSCQEGYEMQKDANGEEHCIKNSIVCPAGYFATGEKGQKACRRALTQGTFFVSSNMSSEECQSNAKTLNGTIIPYNMLQFNLINNGKSLLNSGATENGCVIRVGYETDYQSVKKAVKTSTYNNNFDYVCSKWSCLGGKCKLGICPTVNTRIGNESKPMEYQGKIIPDSIKGQLSDKACLDQICDGNKEHAPMCGLKFQPSTGLSKGVFFKDGKFYQAYCEDKEAVLSDDGATCIVKRCPEGTTKQSNGMCKKK